MHKSSPGSRPIEVAAYYFPSYHLDARNGQWHGQGWTEWDLVRDARPRYPGHQQPKIPAWGYFDESDPHWAAREIDLATEHGITSFIYDWYWYDDASYLQNGLEKGFLKAANRSKMKFALMWANHDWNNMFPARLSNKPEILAQGKVSPEVFTRLCNYVIDRYFSQENYLKIAGRPYFSIYELGSFIQGMGGLDAAARALEQFRRQCEKAGVGEPHLNTVVWQLPVLPGEFGLPKVDEVIQRLGIDSATSYAWIHHYDLSTGQFPQGSYALAAEANYRAWDHYAQTLPVPYFPNVSMGWDSSPRTCQSEKFENRSYPWTAVLEGNTPAAFEQSLRRARTFVEQMELAPPMVTLNAWNEWTEGSYLLPDEHHGDAYLKAVRNVFAASQGRMFPIKNKSEQSVGSLQRTGVTVAGLSADLPI